MATATKPKTKKAKKTKLPKAGKVFIELLLDESGSMGGNQRAVVEGTNEFMGTIKGEKNAKRARVGVSFFDVRAGEDRVRVKRDGEKLDEFEPLTLADYQPMGATPLNDAIIHTIKRVEKKLKGKTDAGMIVVFTDGHENASETSKEDVKKAIAKAEKKGIAFVYLGANVDAQAEGAGIGASNPGAYMGFTSTDKGTRSALRASSGMAMAYIGDAGEFPQMDGAERVANLHERNAKTLGDEIAEDEKDSVPRKS